MLDSGAPDEADDRPGRPATLLFWIAASFYVVYQFLTRGRTILQGSMWAEMGTNYFSVTRTEPWYAQLLATDGGYIPLPQRIIALLGNTLGVSPAAVPYLYTGSALILSGLLIGSICLPAFRPVISSDLLRFVLSISLMLVPDFATRSFINFTYFAIVTAAFVTALAAVSRSREVPVWSWVLPVLIISKPGVLTILPSMVLVSLVSGRRFRRITLACVVAAAIQAIRLMLSSASADSLLQGSQATLSDKLLATAKYSVGIIGRLVAGPANGLGIPGWMVFGLVVVLVAVAAVVVLRGPASVLVLIGLSLVGLTMLVNSFTFSAEFTRAMPMLTVPGWDRRNIIAVAGTFFVVAGLIAVVAESPRVRRTLSGLWPHRRRTPLPRRLGTSVAAGAYVLWFAGTGWFSYVVPVNQPLGLPLADISQWSEQADALDGDEPVVCVPLDPFGWVYGRNCSRLTDDVSTDLKWAALDGGADHRPVLTLDVPRDVRPDALASFALVVQPAPGLSSVTATAVLTDDDGNRREWFTEAELPPGGGLMQFQQSAGPLAEGVASVTVTFDRPVAVGSASAEDATDAVVLWMGQPATGSSG